MRSNRGILIVDDDRAVLDVCEYFVRRLGFEPFKALSGIEAIEIYVNNIDPIQTVILDLTMVPVGGIKTYEELRYLSPEISILFSSGNDQSMVQKLLLNDQRCAFIEKPFTYGQFSDAIMDLQGETERHHFV